jgi:uncharacterized UBP type Zn finger protein
LAHCLDKFTEEEKLSDVVCSKCKEDTGLTTRIQLWRLPPVLVIQIKRFQFTRQSRKKLTTKVQFPILSLDLKGYLAAGRSDESEGMCTEYDLYSTVHHIGALGGGHYVTTALDRGALRSEVESQGGSWLCFNDELVTEISEEEMQGASAYLLFYLRRDMHNSSYKAIFDDFQRNLHRPVDLEKHQESELNVTVGVSAPREPIVVKRTVVSAVRGATEAEMERGRAQGRNTRQKEEKLGSSCTLA